MEEIFNNPFRSDTTRSGTSNDAETFPATSTLRSSSGILSVAFGDSWYIYFDSALFLVFTAPTVRKAIRTTVSRMYYCRAWMSSKWQEHLSKKLQWKGKCEKEREAERKSSVLLAAGSHRSWDMDRRTDGCLSRREDRRNVILPGIIPGSFLSHSASSFEPATRQDHPLSCRSDDSAPKRRSVRASLPPVLFMRSDKSLQRRERRRRRQQRRWQRDASRKGKFSQPSDQRSGAVYFRRNISSQSCARFTSEGSNFAM